MGGRLVSQMIESKEKEKRLTDIIERWANHTKIIPQLREYDISGLVNQILEEFYHIHLSCGHLVNSSAEEIILTFKDYDDGELVDIVGSYCKDCAKKYKKNLGASEVIQ